MSVVQATPSSPGQSRAKKYPVVAEQPKFDLESYISNYSGRTRYERLLLIGVCSAPLGVEALKLAVREAKDGQDARRYYDAQTQLATVGPEEPEAVRDQAWLDKVEKQNQANIAHLEGQLKQYKNNLVKESIRMGNKELGDYFHSMGDLPKAFESYSRMRPDISSSKHIVEVSRLIIEVAVEQRNWIAVTSNVQKIRSVLLNVEEDKPIMSFNSAAEGLAHMDSGAYHEAAKAFIDTEPGMGLSSNSVIGPNDIAIYGGLCALATMERGELHTRVLDNSSFRTYLELEPQIRQAIMFFVNSRYSACLNILESYRADYLLDIYLHKHIEEIYHLIRSKSIVQYFIPFSCVTLDSLNKAFAAPGKNIDKELVLMIQRGELKARIDTVNRVLTAVPSAPRAALHAQALKTAQEYEREARRRILHMNIISSDLEVKPKRQAGLGAIDDMFDGPNTRGRGYGGGY